MVEVDFLDQLVYFSIRDVQPVIRLEDLAELLPGDEARLVLVKVGKGHFEVVLLQIDLALHAPSEELGVINVTVVVSVEHVNQILHLLLRVVDLVLRDSFLEFITCDAAVSIDVYHDEKLSQLDDALFW